MKTSTITEDIEKELEKLNSPFTKALLSPMRLVIRWMKAVDTKLEQLEEQNHGKQKSD